MTLRAIDPRSKPDPGRRSWRCQPGPASKCAARGAFEQLRGKGARPPLWACIALGVALVALVTAQTAHADSGGATINALPDSSNLEAHIEVRHECPGVFQSERERCFWYGEATQYPAGTECPAVADPSHLVGSGSVEEGPGTDSASFEFDPESQEVALCLYVWEGANTSLVGQSHPFDTQTSSEVLPQPKPRQPTRAVLAVKVFDGCKAHIYANAISSGEDEHGGSWSGAELWAPRKAKLIAASSTQPWFWTIEGPAGTYRFRMHFDGSATLLPSPAATVVFRLRGCRPQHS